MRETQGNHQLWHVTTSWLAGCQCHYCCHYFHCLVTVPLQVFLSAGSETEEPASKTSSRQNHIPAKCEYPDASQISPWRRLPQSAAYWDNLSTMTTHPLAFCDECMTWHCHRQTNVTNDAATSECCIHYKRCRCKCKWRDQTGARGPSAVFDISQSARIPWSCWQLPHTVKWRQFMVVCRLHPYLHNHRSCTPWHSKKLLNIVCDTKHADVIVAFSLRFRKQQQ